jgi:membrane protein implicated in regulation of membrane protease activity
MANTGGVDVSLTWLWIGAAVVAIVIEIFTLELTFALLAAGALAAAGGAALGLPVLVQVALAAGVWVLGLLVIRPIALRHLRPHHTRTGIDALPGTRARALTEVTADHGRIQLRGEQWSARLDPDVTSEPVPTGTLLIVTRIDGATALVHPIDEL